MPALVFLRRKWLIACDDFTIPFAIEAFIRIYWCISLSTLLFLKLNNCTESLHNQYFIYAALCDLSVTSFLSLLISTTSSRGSVLEVGKRKYLPNLLFVKIVAFICDIVIVSYGTWIAVNAESACRTQDIFIMITIIVGWIYFLFVLVSVAICYDTLGAPKFWDSEVNSSSLNFFKKAQFMWRWRLKCFCCCADISEENDYIYVEISSFLSSFLNGIDLVPTDILAGIVTLSQKHILERRKYMLKHMPKSLELLESTGIPDWMTIENALYFLRVAKSTYGWIAFFDVFQPWNLCLLSPYARYNPDCFQHSEAKIDNCCYLNSAAVQRISGFKDADIIYASFRNSIHEPAFYIALDHRKKYVIIAIRGTRSFSDILTDIDAENLWFPSEEQHRFKCHRGALRSALFLQKIINELNLLEQVFTEYPSYTLALTGHSLGGSIASILAMILLPKFPNLQCYTYGALAAISSAGISETLNCVLSVVVGEDLAPRLCAASCLELRKMMIQSLRESKLPKYKILSQACWYHVLKYFASPSQRRTTEGRENVNFNEDEERGSNTISTSTEDTQLYAPGRILYFERRKWEAPYWLTGLNLQNIIINPDMITDHQPHKIKRYLEKYQESLQDKPRIVVN